MFAYLFLFQNFRLNNTNTWHSRMSFEVSVKIYSSPHDIEKISLLCLDAPNDRNITQFTKNLQTDTRNDRQTSRKLFALTFSRIVLKILSKVRLGTVF